MVHRNEEYVGQYKLRPERKVIPANSVPYGPGSWEGGVEEEWVDENPGCRGGGARYSAYLYMYTYTYSPFLLPSILCFRCDIVLHCLRVDISRTRNPLCSHWRS